MLRIGETIIIVFRETIIDIRWELLVNQILVLLVSLNTIIIVSPILSISYITFLTSLQASPTPVL